MKKLFIVSDVHSHYDELKKALDDAGFDINNKDHVFVNCGDFFDRGNQPIKCLDFVNSLPDNRKILLLGNHELLLEELIKQGVHSYDHTNGTFGTAVAIQDDTINYQTEEFRDNLFYDVQINNKWNKYRNSLRNYFEVENYIFVHGWIPCRVEGYDHDLSVYTKDDEWRKATKRQWEDSTWICCYDAWNNNVREKDKIIVAGHWHTCYGHANFHHLGKEYPDNYDDVKNCCVEPFYDEGIIGLDAMTTLSGKVNCITVVVDDKNFTKALKVGKRG